MYTDLKKTLTVIDSCIPDDGAPGVEQLHRMYDLTLRLMSQELSLIYDQEAFGRSAGQERRTFARRQRVGVNKAPLLC